MTLACPPPPRLRRFMYYCLRPWNWTHTTRLGLCSTSLCLLRLRHLLSTVIVSTFWAPRSLRSIFFCHTTHCPFLAIFSRSFRNLQSFFSTDRDALMISTRIVRPVLSTVDLVRSFQRGVPTCVRGLVAEQQSIGATQQPYNTI